MLRGSRARRAVAGVGAVAVLVLTVFGCDAVLGLGDYHVGTEQADTGPPIDSPSNPDETGGPDSGVDCDVDLTQTCYACTPTTNDQFQNSCPDNTCIPFDESRVTGLL